MSKPANYCDECRHYSMHRIDTERTPCSIGHRPRFYTPQNLSQAHSSDWGWKRRCPDFAPKREGQA